jgi:hypothetical protein
MLVQVRFSIAHVRPGGDQGANAGLKVPLPGRGHGLAQTRSMHGPAAACGETDAVRRGPRAVHARLVLALLHLGER